MDWQEITALAIVVLTIGVFAWKTIARRNKPCACGGCGGGKPPAPASTIYRWRKGQRPTLTVSQGAKAARQTRPPE